MVAMACGATSWTNQVGYINYLQHNSREDNHTLALMWLLIITLWLLCYNYDLLITKLQYYSLEIL